jgi:CheY-like chemotaxis protein
VREAGDFEATLSILRSSTASGSPFDLALVDARLGEQDGFSLAATIREDAAWSGLRLVMMTSAGQRGDSERCRHLGIEGYMAKPISRLDMLEGVVAVLRGEAPARRSQVVTRHTIAEARRHLRVLLAEDNPVNQEVAATMLRRRGHHVDVVGEGAQAVEAAGRSPYDVILMDIQMPELDGFAATSAIRALPGRASTHIVALTAHALSGERERCLAAGMNGYLTKPFKPADLFNVVERGVPSFQEDSGAPRMPHGVESSIDAPPVDIEAFRRNLQDAGAEDALDGLLETFVHTVPDRLRALAAAAAASDGPAMARAAHALKSAAGAVGAWRGTRPPLPGRRLLVSRPRLSARCGSSKTGIQYLAHLPANLIGGEGFLQKGGVPGPNGRLYRRPVGVPRDEQDPRAGADLPDGSGDVGAIAVRQYDVGHDEMDLPRVVHADSFGRRRIRGY